METALITAPAVEPVLLAAAKIHLRIPVAITDSDTNITTLLSVAREMVEQETNRKLITQTWDIYLDDWPGGDVIELPFGSLQSITHIKYTDSDGDETTFSSADYSADIASALGRVVLDYDASWPSATLANKTPIVIRIICGYGLTGATVPGPVIQAINFVIADFFENRETVVIGVTVTNLDIVERLLAPYRLYGYHL